jgi:hypothetical protein
MNGNGSFGTTRRFGEGGRVNTRFRGQTLHSIQEVPSRPQASLRYQEAPPSPSSVFGLDSLESTLEPPVSQKPPPVTSPPSHPGVRFCSSLHGKFAAKAAAFGTPVAAEPRVEIAPGVTARLRGSQETWECVERDFYLPVTCFSCNLDLCVIMDANLVICPRCRVVSPIDDCSSEGLDGGVGLGFTYDDLRQWQYEIIRRRQRQPQTW